MDRCKGCGHLEDDHDGYGGLCDGLQADALANNDRELFESYMDSRSMCGCEEFVSSHPDQ